MTDAWDGRPEHPERDGWHWVASTTGGDAPMGFYWSAPRELWLINRYGNAAHLNHKAWRYIGPCLTPAEVAARIAEAVAQEREACVALLTPQNDPSDWTEYAHICAECAAAIRARKDSAP